MIIVIEPVYLATLDITVIVLDGCLCFKSKADYDKAYNSLSSIPIDLAVLDWFVDPTLFK